MSFFSYSLITLLVIIFAAEKFSGVEGIQCAVCTNYANESNICHESPHAVSLLKTCPSSENQCGKIWSWTKGVSNRRDITVTRFCTSGKRNGCEKKFATYFTYAKCACTTHSCNKGSKTQSVDVITFTLLALAGYTMKWM